MDTTNRRTPSRPRRRPLAATVTGLALLAMLMAACSAPSSASPSRTLSNELHQLVTMKGGPVGAIALVQRGSHLQLTTAGAANRNIARAVTDGDLMRLASVSKAYNGAVALSLVEQGKLALTDTIAQRLPDLPPVWGAVTLAQLLRHTSGLPDYTKDPTFQAQFSADPLRSFTPQQLVDFVAGEPLDFPPGSRYHYSDTDNIVVGLMVEAVTDQPYATVLAQTVLSPLSLTHTSLPNTATMGEPALHGYALEAGKPPEDITTAINPSGAWASGGMVSTPSELNTFMRGYVSGRFFGPTVKADQRQFVAGSSGPPGPGTNAAGLAIFRYQTRCGTVYGHTGNFPGYTMFAAATSSGRDSVVVAVNVQLNNTPVTPAYTALRNLESTAVCASLSR